MSQSNSTKTYFIVMGLFWLVFGLITLFFPALMNLFQTEAGINAITAYSDHVWKHDGFDILSVSILFFALSREVVSRNMIRASAFVALLVIIAITSSLLTTPYWNMLFVVPGVTCAAFAAWGFKLAAKSAG